MIPEYSAGGTRRGRNFDISFENIQVTAPRVPPSYFAGFDDQHESRDIRIRNLTLNEQRITTLEEANIAVGAHASNITIE